MKSPVEKLSNALSPMSITEDSMSLSQRLTVKTDTLELVRKMNKQLQYNNVRQRLKYLTDYFTYLSAKDLD